MASAPCDGVPHIINAAAVVAKGPGALVEVGDIFDDGGYCGGRVIISAKIW